MAKKVLFVATVVKAHIMVFHLPYLKMFKELSYEVHVAAKNDFSSKGDCEIPYCDKYFDIEFERFPLNTHNIKAYRKLKKIIATEKYDIVHCHTPVGGLLGRLCSKGMRSKGTKVYYTAHGFHFYQGAPKINWLAYYPVEKLCAKYTDVLITINKEDYKLAKNKMKAKKIVCVPGVGIDLEKFANLTVDKVQKREELDIPSDAFLLLSVGELNENKNHEIVIRALSKLENINVHYAIAGKGDLKEHLENIVEEQNIKDKVHLLGFRNDVAELYKTADCFIHPSFREGLPVSIMEAMASGLPVICSTVRGNMDLVDKDGGWLFCPQSVEECQNAITSAIGGDLEAMGQYNLEKSKQFEIENILSVMREIYGL